MLVPMVGPTLKPSPNAGVATMSGSVLPFDCVMVGVEAFRAVGMLKLTDTNGVKPSQPR